VIFVVVKNEKKLLEVVEELSAQGIEFSAFREPDEPFNNSMTAVCTEPLHGERRTYLSKFMLLK
jgi:hypothetical protein